MEILRGMCKILQRKWKYWKENGLINTVIEVEQNVMKNVKEVKKRIIRKQKDEEIKIEGMKIEIEELTKKTNKNKH